MFLETVSIIVSKVTAFDLSNADSNKGDFLPKLLKLWEKFEPEGKGRVLIMAVVWFFHMLCLKPLPQCLTRHQAVDRIDSLRCLSQLLAVVENFPEGKKSTLT